jgi:hypothetical protein
VSLPEEGELESVPRWIEGHTILVQFVECPWRRYGLCQFVTSFVEEYDDEDEARRLYEEHWRDNH